MRALLVLLQRQGTNLKIKKFAKKFSQQHICSLWVLYESYLVYTIPYAICLFSVQVCCVEMHKP